jgi:hypothetical protein
MLVYWSIYAVPAFVALFEKTRRHGNSLSPILFFLLCLFFIMAFRDTGGDFLNYNELIQVNSGESLASWMLLTDPAYGFLNWLSIQAGWGIYGVNFFCALIFLYGLYRFALDEPRRALLIAIAIPYLVIVVAIGYTRQGTAIGVIMLALIYIRRRNIVNAAILIAMATAFHSSALITAPLLSYSTTGRRYTRYIAVPTMVLFLAGGYSILFERFSNLHNNYVGSDLYQSSGAVQRAFITAVAGAIFWFYRRRWNYRFGDARLYFFVSLTAIALLPASFFFSTAVDRIGLFLLPFQVLVFARLPVLQSNKSMEQLATAGVLFAYTLILFVWLHMGQFAQLLWLPYSNLLTGPLP